MKNVKLFLVAVIIGISCLSCMNSLYMSGYTPISNSPNENILSKHDEFSDMTIYEHRNLHIYQRPVQLMVGKSKGEYFLSFYCKYKGNGWIFFEDVILMNSKSDKISFHFKDSDLSRDVRNSGYVSEVGDIILLRSDIDKLKQFIKDEELIKVRFSGKKYNDTKLNKEAIKSIKEIISFYESRDNKLALK